MRGTAGWRDRGGIGGVARGEGCDELDLVLAVTQGPTAATGADDVELLEEGALVPIEADAGDFLGGIVGDEVDLFWKSAEVRDVKGGWPALTTGNVQSLSRRKLSSRPGR